jgi:1-acyl-sn-glycerol-3-phosphate acyltransferase
MSELPTISPRLYAGFTRYASWFARRNFHAVRLLRGAGPRVPGDRPIIVYLNHPSWWDPMLGMVLVRAFFAEQTHFAPIDADALEKYRFFRKLGFFGVERGTRRGAAQFARVGRRVMQEDDSVLWVTAQGHFTDPRVRPVELQPGVAHLARRMGRGVLLPLALEYPFWEERYPEALCAFGKPIDVAEHRGLDVAGWQSLLTQRLERTQDDLAAAAIVQDAARFELIDTGNAGVGGVYDLWRRIKSVFTGRRFDPRHGSSEVPR